MSDEIFTAVNTIFGHQVASNLVVQMDHLKLCPKIMNHNSNLHFNERTLGIFTQTHTFVMLTITVVTKRFSQDSMWQLKGFHSSGSGNSPTHWFHW